jgi:hypothetical protein
MCSGHCFRINLCTYFSINRAGCRCATFPNIDWYVTNPFPIGVYIKMNSYSPPFPRWLCLRPNTLSNRWANPPMAPTALWNPAFPPTHPFRAHFFDTEILDRRWHPHWIWRVCYRVRGNLHELENEAAWTSIPEPHNAKFAGHVCEWC